MGYNIAFYWLATWLIPYALRKEKFLILVKALIYPLIFVHNSFLNYRKAKLYQLMITPQVCYLERLLNDRWDSTLRRIVIVDAVWFPPTFMYQEAELKPVNLYQEGENNPVIIYTEGEAGVLLDDFVVLVPLDVIFDDAEMKGLLNIYKLAGTKYSIQRI